MLDNFLSPMHLIASLAALLPMLAIYCLPTLVATWRNHPSRTPILLLNVLLGWTAVAWICALIWSLTSPALQSARAPSQPAQ